MMGIQEPLIRVLEQKRGKEQLEDQECVLQYCFVGWCWFLHCLWAIELPFSWCRHTVLVMVFAVQEDTFSQELNCYNVLRSQVEMYVCPPRILYWMKWFCSNQMDFPDHSVFLQTQQCVSQLQSFYLLCAVSLLFFFIVLHLSEMQGKACGNMTSHGIWQPQCRMVFLTICIQDGVDKVWGLSESDLGWGMGCFSLLSCFIDSSVPQCDLLTHGVLWRMVTSSLLLSWLKKALTKNSLFPPSSPQHSTTLWPSLLNTQFCLYPDTLKLYSLCSSLLYPRIKVLLIHRNGRTRPAFFFQKRRCKRL